MYSPKIYECFIPDLYLWAKDEQVAMTKLVNKIIDKAVKKRRRYVKKNRRIMEKERQEQSGILFRRAGFRLSGSGSVSGIPEQGQKRKPAGHDNQFIGRQG